MAVMNEELFQVADKSFLFAVDIVKLFEGMDANKSKYPSKQLMRYGTQIGAKVVRSGTDFTRTGFIKCFAVALRRCEQTIFWLSAVYKLNYISQMEYLEYHLNLEALHKRMETFLNKIRLNKAILTMGEVDALNERTIHYN